MNKKQIFILIISALFTFSIGSSAQNQIINLTGKNISLKMAFDQIEKQTGFSVDYDSKVIDIRKVISIPYQTFVLKDLMSLLLKDTKCNYIIDKSHIIISHFLEEPKENDSGNKDVSKKISGLVTDEKGDPIIGASIVLKGSNTGTITSVDGTFSLEVPNQSEITISYIGFKQTVLKLGKANNYKIILEEDSKTLDEVIVVGYGTQKKINLTGSIATLKFDGKLTSRPVMNASTALSGKVAGLSVFQSSGKPGDDNATLRVRGTTTINNSSPLVLVDGFEADMNNVNMNDIESITILKDASATAVYGSRAANGVILVSTKMGIGEPKVTLNSFMSSQSPVNKIEFVTDYAEHMEYINEGRKNMGKSEIFSLSNIENWRTAKANPNELNEYNVPNYIAYPNTNWFNEIFMTGIAQEHNISVQGGEKSLKYLISGGYVENQGIMKNSALEKYQLRANFETKAYTWWTLGAKFFGLKQEKGMANISRGFEYLPQTSPGIYPGVDNKWGSPALTNQESSTANNIFEKMALGGYDKMFRANITLFSKINLFKNINLETSYNYAPDWGDYASWSVQAGTWNYVENKRLSDSNLENGIITNSSFKRARYSADILLRYNIKLNNNHELNTLLGYNQTYYNENVFSASTKGMTDWDLHVLNTGLNLKSMTGSESDWSLRSCFGRINYSYKSKYLAEANLRYDESSRFGTDVRGGFFPSFSAGWRITEEKFMQGTSNLIQNLKLRGSWGLLGNNQLGNYDWQAGYSVANVVLDGIPQNSLVVSKQSNSLLRWESVATSDLGIDFSILNGKLAGEIDYYHKLTTGMILTPDTYLTMGTVTPATQNTAELTNQGIEITLNWRDKIGNLTFELGGNFSLNKNLVTKYRGELKKGWTTDENGTSYYENNVGEVSRSGFGGLIVEGHTLGESYLRSLYRGSGNYNPTSTVVDVNAGPKDGMIRTENDMKWVLAMQAAGYKFSPLNTVSQNSLWYGDLIYADKNNDGIYGDSNDMDFTGNSQLPKYNFGFNFTAAYKQFDFSMVLSGSAGFSYYWKSQGYNSPRTQNGWSISKYYAENAYRFDFNDIENSTNNQNALFPRLLDETEGSNGVSSEFWEYDASFIKVKNIQIGYTVPSNISKRILMETARLYLSAENLYTITSFPGLDPEIGASVGYPTIKQFTLGVNITF